MYKKGIIFDIQRFSLHDGPGIRTTIFFKGCSLRCRWCHNPESISPRVQLAYDSKKCVLCGKCVAYKAGDGIDISGDKLFIDLKKHEASYDLIPICPNRAYSTYGKEYKVDELVQIVMKDKNYYENSSGGVTFSGGEALNQFEFIKVLAEELKRQGIHILLDLSGYDPLNLVERTTDFIDGYLLDYKLTEKEDYKHYVGHEIDAHRILDILEHRKAGVILRCPIIPGVNDTKVHFKEISKISNQYCCIKEVTVLPYHNLKKGLQFHYLNKPEHFSVPTEEDKDNWRELFQTYYLKNGVMDHKKI